MPLPFLARILAKEKPPMLGRWRPKTDTEALNFPVADPGYSLPLHGPRLPSAEIRRLRSANLPATFLLKHHE